MAEPRIGIVIIGRNEGERLMRCIQSVQAVAVAIVYVDSSSHDGSVGNAQGCGVDAVALDPAQPFTAARGRNEGFRFLTDKYPAMKHVQPRRCGTVCALHGPVEDPGRTRASKVLVGAGSSTTKRPY